MTKISIDFQEQKNLKELKEWQVIADSLNELNTLSNVITKGELITHKLDDLKNYFSEKTSFPNAEANASLLSVETEYKAYVINYAKLKNISDKDILKNFKQTPKGLILDDKFIAELEISNTIYLPKELEAAHTKLNKVVVLMNEIEHLGNNSSTALQRTYKGEWELNLKQLNMAFQLR